MPKAGATAAIGWPSTTACRGSRAPPPRWSSATSPRARRPSGSGAGGIMLPNHSPLVVAEQFGTLESLFPGRIDLGLGRAPGSDQLTAQALRRAISPRTPNSSPRTCQEAHGILCAAGIRAAHHGGAGRRVESPVWILGSSLFGAHVAAALGLPFAFRVAFRARHDDAGLGRVSRAVSGPPNSSIVPM